MEETYKNNKSMKFKTKSNMEKPTKQRVGSLKRSIKLINLQQD